MFSTKSPFCENKAFAPQSTLHVRSLRLQLSNGVAARRRMNNESPAQPWVFTFPTDAEWERERELRCAFFSTPVTHSGFFCEKGCARAAAVSSYYYCMRAKTKAVRASSFGPVMQMSLLIKTAQVRGPWERESVRSLRLSPLWWQGKMSRCRRHRVCTRPVHAWALTQFRCYLFIQHRAKIAFEPPRAAAGFYFNLGILAESQQLCFFEITLTSSLSQP